MHYCNAVKRLAKSLAGTYLHVMKGAPDGVPGDHSLPLTN